MHSGLKTVRRRVGSEVAYRFAMGEKSAIPTLRAWSSSTAYAVYDVVAYTDPTTSDITLYRCTTAHTSTSGNATR